MPPAAGAGHRAAARLACAWLLAGWGLLAGCGGPPPAPPLDQVPEDPPAASPAGEADPSATAARVVAGFLGIEPARVQVLDLTAEVFPDASLGCPEPDMLYAQVLTPGWRVLAEAEGRRFDVRVAGAGGRICQRKSLPEPGRRSEDTTVERAARLARDDLARRAGAGAGEIHLLGWWPVPAGREVPGCAIDCPDDATGCGLLLELELDQRRYRYHVSEDSARPCIDISAD